jgi:protein ImuB
MDRFLTRVFLTDRAGYTNIRSMPVACALIPRFRLIAAVGNKGILGRPAALAPEPGAAQLIGEVTDAAEGFGLRIGMRMGEALSRCPELILIPPDPERAEGSWEEALRRLEGIGAEVESDRAGEAFFEAGGLTGLWGGIEGVLKRVRKELGRSVQLGAGPGRFPSYVAAHSAAIVPDGAAAEFLDPMPVSLLCGRLGGDQEADDLPNELERLGISTLGRLAGLPRDAVADRFGRLGLRALRLARGDDEPLRPRPVREAIAVELELPEAVSGQQLERSLELLISRLLAHGERRGRTLRALRLSARLAAGGGWRRQIALRRASADRVRLADALLPHLALLPAPAATLRLEAVAMGPETGDQLTLSSPEQERRRRLSEAVRQTRSAAGADAVLRVLEVDPESRVPERREVLMPWSEGAPQPEARRNPSNGEAAKQWPSGNQR